MLVAVLMKKRNDVVFEPTLCSFSVDRSSTYSGSCLSEDPHCAETRTNKTRQAGAGLAKPWYGDQRLGRNPPPTPNTTPKQEPKTES